MSSPTRDDHRVGDGPRDGADDLALAREAVLADRIRARTGQRQRSVAVTPRVGTGPAPLSVCQRQLWYLHELAPQSSVYNELITLRKVGELDVEALREAFSEFVRRHEAWRTSFHVVDGEPRQVVHDPAPLDLPLHDLSHLSRDDAERAAAELAADDVRRPYDLAAGPPLRPRLIRFSATEHRLALGLHHIVFDGVTLYRILLPEIIALYDDRVAGRGWSLPQPAVQYPDFAAWEVAWAQGPQMAARARWWTTRLAGLPSLELPLDHPRAPAPRFRGATVPLEVGASTVEALRDVGHRTGSTLFQVVAALHAWWLGHYAGQDDVAFATIADLRRQPELVGMAGYCLTPIVLRADVAGSASALELVARLRSGFVDALDHAVPFEALVRALPVARAAGATPLVNAALVLEPPVAAADASWSLHQLDARGAAVGGAKFDLLLELDERPEGHLQGRLIYDSDLLDAATARSMTSTWLRLVEAAASTPEAPLGELDLAEGDDQPVTALPSIQDAPLGVHERVLAQVARTPDALAVTSGEGSLTFAELARAAQDVAAQLADSGAGRGTIVATVLERGVDLVVGLLGVLMTGAAYLPLNPAEPASRLRDLTLDAGATVGLVSPARTGALAGVEVPVVLLDRSPDPRPFEPVAARPDDLAYVIYTSGSTGRPKGVVVEHANASHLMSTLYQRMGIGQGDTVVCVVPYTFDVSVSDMFCSLALGASIVLASTEQATDHRALGHLLEGCGASVLWATPTTWAGLLQAGWAGDPGLLAVCAGEALPDALARTLSQRCRALWNAYGPTETTVIVSCGPVTDDAVVTAGTPLPGTPIWVLDDAGRPRPPGMPGEVVVGGPLVTRGYLGRPQETAARFVPAPGSGAAGSGAAGERAYRTGDRGRLRADGTLQLLGRLDDQVKVRGFRIEPGEVEAALTAHPDVAAAAVVAWGSGGERQLVAYVTGLDSTSDRQLRAWLRSRLPEHLVPSVLIRLPHLPQTTSGKVDRAALPDPTPELLTQTPPEASGRPPSTPTEQRLAQIWGRLLGSPVSDAEADFFELGGYSLLAARLVVAVERALRVPVSIADLLAHGTTIAGLAELVDARARPPAPPQTDRGVRPLFCVFPTPAAAVSLRHLSRSWGEALPVVLLHVHDRHDSVDRTADVESLALPLLAQLREHQPAGPYALAGFSLGGLLAYELARRLLADGEEVEWLGLLDAATPALAAIAYDGLSASGRLSRQRQRSPAAQARKLVEVVRRTGSQVLLPWRESSRLARFEGRRALNVARRYAQPGHGVPVDLFTCEESVAVSGRPALGWEDLHQGPLRVHDFSGDHLSLVKPPHVGELSRLMIAAVQEARGAGVGEL